MILSNKVRLELNKKQELSFWQFSGVRRFSWNVSLNFYEDFRKKNGSLATLSDMMKHLQDLKHNNPDYAWLNTVPEAITKQSMKDLKKAYGAYYKKKKEYGYVSYTKKQIEHAARIGKELTEYDKQGHPKFKKKGKCTESFYQRTDNIHKTDDTHIKLTGIKDPVKCTALRGVDLPEHILNPRISFDEKYWYLTYSFKVDDADIVDKEYLRERLGIDLGVKDFAILSDGQTFGNINKTPEVCRLRKRLKYLQHKLPKKYEANKTMDKNGKKVFHKTNNIKKLETQIRHLYRRIANIQRTYMYEVVKAVMKTKSQSIVLEDLNVKGMLQNPKLARVIQEQNISEFKRIMAYKCERYGIDLYLADRWYPSSKTCSCCGWYNKDMKLTDRIFVCEECGIKIDRDFNAAVNLENCPSDKFKKIEFNVM